MAGRTTIPKGAAAEAELRRRHRSEQRAARRRRRKIEEIADRDGITFERAEARLVAEERSTAQPATRAPAAIDDRITQDPSTLGPEAAEPYTVEQLKKDLMVAFHSLGGVQGLVAWGKRSPKDFYALWGRYCLPTEDDNVGEDGVSLEAVLAQIDSPIAN